MEIRSKLIEKAAIPNFPTSIDTNCVISVSADKEHRTITCNSEYLYGNMRLTQLNKTECHSPDIVEFTVNILITYFGYTKN